MGRHQIEEMATDILCRKRGITEAFGSPSCSPHKIAFLDLADSAARRAKRTAAMMQGEGMNLDRGGSMPTKALRGLMDVNVPRPRTDSSAMEESPFRGSACEGGGSCGENMPVNDKPKLCRMCKQRPAERLYTGEEVRDIVQRAIARREGEIRTEFDQVLQQRLADQFNNFRRFHEDYVSRQLNQSDYSYMS